MSRSTLIPSLLVSLMLAPTASAAVFDEGGVRTFSPDGLVSDASGADADALPRGVSGLVPDLDGDPFFLEVEPGLYRGDDDRALLEALSEILPAVGYKGDVKSLEIEETTWLGSVPVEEARAEREQDTRDLTELLTRRFERLSEVTERAIEAQGDENEALMLETHAAVRISQIIDGLPVRGLGLRVRLDDDGSISAITGALTDRDALDGRLELDAEKAGSIAKAAVEGELRVDDVAVGDPIAVADGKQLRPAWPVYLTDGTGAEVEVLVDGETGDVLGVEDLSMNYTSAQGRAFWPDPTGVNTEQGFEVNDAVKGKYTLTHDDEQTVTSFGADGCAASQVTVSGAGFADFDVSPINGLVVRDVTQAGYNCQFQEVNAFIQVDDALYWFKGLGAEPSPPIPVRVDVNFACNSGQNQACAGGGMLTFGIGSATMTGSTSSGFLNAALDQTVVVHELGHHVTARQVAVGGGTLTGSLSEGMSDYWSMADADVDTFAGYWGSNAAAPVQSGQAPRQAESLDVFPEHFALGGNEAHANGQMIAWAQWGFRTEMADRGPLGAGLASRIAVSALTGTGFGVTNNLGTHEEVYGSYQSMLSSELLETGYAQARVDLLQAFARAGVFTTAHEAIIDISDDYLSPADQPPTFTVWPGEDFSFDASGKASDATSYNENFEIELANDAGFTVNVQDSGAKTGFAEDGNGNTIATWTPSAKQWAKLTSGSLLYYRVHTWTGDHQRTRDSEHTMAGFMQVPTAVAVINGGGSAGCATGGTRAAGWLGAALAGAALLRRRRQG